MTYYNEPKSKVYDRVCRCIGDTIIMFNKSKKRD